MMNLSACASFQLEPTEDVHTFSSNLSIIVVVSVIFVLVAAFTTFANLTVIIALTRSLIKDHNGGGFLKSHNEISKYLMTSMAVTDATLGSFVMPLGVYELIYNGKWFLSQELCKARYTADVFLSTVSIYHVTCMAVDRYLAVCRPLVYRRLPIRTCYFMIGVSWTLPGVLILMPIFSGWHDDGLEDLVLCLQLNNLCRINFSSAFQIGAATVSFYFPIIIIFILYSLIMKEVYLYQKRLPKRCDQSILSKRELNLKHGGEGWADSCSSEDSSSSWDHQMVSNGGHAIVVTPSSELHTGDSVSSTNSKQIFRSNRIWISCCFESIRGKFGHSTQSAVTYQISLRSNDTNHFYDPPTACDDNNTQDQTGSYVTLETTLSTVQTQTSPEEFMSCSVITTLGKDISTMEASHGYEIQTVITHQPASSISLEQLKTTDKVETAPAIAPFAQTSSVKSKLSTDLTPSEIQGSAMSLNSATINTTAQTTNAHAVLRRKPGRNNLKAVQTVGAIVICFTLCWLPFGIYIGVSSYIPYPLPLWSAVIVTWLGYINSALNPILYCGNKSIRETVLGFLCGSHSE